MSFDPSFLPESEVRSLIIRAQEGDREAFAQVIEQVRPFICKLARQYGRRLGGAPVEDLIQTGLLAAVRSVPLFNTNAGVKFVSYVGVAARRAIHRAAIAWKALPQAGGEESDFLGELPDHHQMDPRQSDAESASEVRSLIEAHLGSRDRHLIGQRFGLDGLPPQTYAEMALVSGTSRQNVQQLVERALKRLRSALDDAIQA